MTGFSFMDLGLRVATLARQSPGQSRTTNRSGTIISLDIAKSGCCQEAFGGMMLTSTMKVCTAPPQCSNSDSLMFATTTR